MIYLRVELWPLGDRNQATLLGEATIANVGGTRERGEYEVALSDMPAPGQNVGLPPHPGQLFGRTPEDVADTENGDAGVWRRGEVKRYDRSLPVWHLIAQAVKAAIGKATSDADTVDRNAWGTPDYILDVVREGFGGTIHTDPASNAVAQERVKADVWHGEGSPFGADGNGFMWNDAVFLNPPYGAGLIAPFADTLDASIHHTTCSAHAVLVNLDPSTEWFRKLSQLSTHTCLLHKRVGFLHPVTGKPIKGNPRPQCLLLRNVNLAPFEKIGTVQAIRQ